MLDRLLTRVGDRGSGLARVRALAEVINSGIQPLQNLTVTQALVELGVDDKAWVRRFVHAGLVAFDGLVVEAARTHGAVALLRGIRGAIDWDYEMRMAFANRALAPALDTVFLPPSQAVAPISASLVREVARLGGDVGAWVHPRVAEALAEAGDGTGPGR